MTDTIYVSFSGIATLGCALLRKQASSCENEIWRSNDSNETYRREYNTNLDRTGLAPFVEPSSQYRPTAATRHFPRA
jgi:hypothetical protein